MKKKSLKKISNSKAPIESKKDDRLVSFKTNEDGQIEVCIYHNKLIPIFGIENESLAKQLAVQAMNASGIYFVKQDGYQDKIVLESTLSMRRRSVRAEYA